MSWWSQLVQPVCSKDWLWQVWTSFFVCDRKACNRNCTLANVPWPATKSGCNRCRSSPVSGFWPVRQLDFKTLTKRHVAYISSLSWILLHGAAKCHHGANTDWNRWHTWMVPSLLWSLLEQWSHPFLLTTPATLHEALQLPYPPVWCTKWTLLLNCIVQTYQGC